MRRRGLDDFADDSGDNGTDSGGHVTGTVNRQQAMSALEIKEWRKNRRRNVARPNDKLVVGARKIYKRKMEDNEVEK